MLNFNNIKFKLMYFEKVKNSFFYIAQSITFDILLKA